MEDSGVLGTQGIASTSSLPHFSSLSEAIFPSILIVPSVLCLLIPLSTRSALPHPPSSPLLSSLPQQQS